MLSTSQYRVRFLVGAVGTVLLGAAAATAEPPLDPPRQYQIRGDGYMTVAGPNCCNDTRFSGQFQAAYHIRSTGEVALSALRFVLDDAEVEVRGGFLDLFSETLRFRCAAFGAKRPALGWVSGGELHFSAGSVRLAGFSAEERLLTGACAAPTLALEEATNHGLVKILHDPAGNRVELDGTFSGVWLEGDGEPYDITLHARGRFDNRPPVARLQFETPAAPQGINCPAVWLPNPAEWVAEANHPAGLVATLRSASTDPDAPIGASSRSDLLSERWLLSRDGGPRQLVGLGYRTGPVGFEWGPVHSLDLLAMDLAGATSAAAPCRFRVVDTRPPVVTPPASTTVVCSQPGGASASTSPALNAFLGGASALDEADPAPVPLAPLMGGAPVTATTFFPADEVPRRVTFLFRDFSGNVGAAQADVTVFDPPPLITVSLTPSRLPADEKWHSIQATITVRDDCGGPVVLKLHKIASDLPSYDGVDISGATFGTDDRFFALFTRVPGGGKKPTRTFRVTYKGTDPAGNATYAFADVKVS